MTDDLLPTSQTARAILAALDTLQQAGVKPTLAVRPGDEHAFTIAVTPLIIGAARLRDLLPLETKAILDARYTLRVAGLDVHLHVDQAPFYVAMMPTTGLDDALLSVLEHQWQAAAADLIVIQAKLSRA